MVTNNKSVSIILLIAIIILNHAENKGLIKFVRKIMYYKMLYLIIILIIIISCKLYY